MRHCLQLHKQRGKDHFRRQGGILICVLVCLLVAVLISAANLRSALRLRRECKLTHQLIQTELLVDAGLARALKQLQLDPKYIGETWQIDQATTGIANASVEITVDSSKPAESPDKPIDEATSERLETKITVRARIDSQSGTQRTSSFLIDGSGKVTLQAE